MAAIMSLKDGECFLTANAPNALTWLDNGQVIVHLADGGVLSARRDETGTIRFSSAPAGSQSAHEKAWPHPTATKPPTFLTYWPDEGKNGQGIGYLP